MEEDPLRFVNEAVGETYREFGDNSNLEDKLM